VAGEPLNPTIAARRKITARHPVYLKYQARAARQIPVILLQPTTG
jgi:hypothetical protein